MTTHTHTHVCILCIHTHIHVCIYVCTCTHTRTLYIKSLIPKGYARAYLCATRAVKVCHEKWPVYGPSCANPVWQDEACGPVSEVCRQF